MNKKMDSCFVIKEKIADKGFAVMDDVFTEIEIDRLVQVISQADISKSTFRKNTHLFAIRQFFKEIPATVSLIFTDRFINFIRKITGEEYFVVKSVYFDKPPTSNWFVAWHQDLTISVDAKKDIVGFGPWTSKHNQYAVQPYLQILEDNFTIRIHLDDANEENGALKIIPGSHVKGICRPETIDLDRQIICPCPVKKGGIMFMKPLLLHASGRSINNLSRRVIHIEFSRAKLPGGLQWAESLSIRPLPVCQTG
jgi:ectoine hydroxylase-related dioxygenase (phytanoyl-CoA dioxygenase family)